MIDYILENRFKLLNKIGKGSQGDVFLALDLTGKQKNVAIKMEKKQRTLSILYCENKMQQSIRSSQPDAEGFPEIISFGCDGEFNFLVMQLLSRPLDFFFEACNYSFDTHTIINIGYQMITRIELLHNCNYIHRDIKPENFMLGGPNNDMVYLLDLGLAKKQRNKVTHQHSKYAENAGHVGTLRYMSLNTHNSIELSRRDDLESVMYILIQLFKGKLPWQGIKARKPRIKQEKIKEKKMSTSIEQLCNGLPTEIGVLMNQTRNLRFEDRPDQTQIQSILLCVLKKQMLKVDNYYCWIKLELNLEHSDEPQDIREQFEDNQEENEPEKKKKKELDQDSENSL